jgi:hypothetical protein
MKSKSKVAPIEHRIVTLEAVKSVLENSDMNRPLSMDDQETIRQLVDIARTISDQEMQFRSKSATLIFEVAKLYAYRFQDELFRSGSRQRTSDAVEQLWTWAHSQRSIEFNRFRNTDFLQHPLRAFWNVTAPKEGQAFRLLTREEVFMFFEDEVKRASELSPLKIPLSGTRPSDIYIGKYVEGHPISVTYFDTQSYEKNDFVFESYAELLVFLSKRARSLLVRIAENERVMGQYFYLDEDQISPLPSQARELPHEARSFLTAIFYVYGEQRSNRLAPLTLNIKALRDINILSESKIAGDYFKKTNISIKKYLQKALQDCGVRKADTRDLEYDISNLAFDLLIIKYRPE